MADTAEAQQRVVKGLALLRDKEFKILTDLYARGPGVRINARRSYYNSYDQSQPGIRNEVHGHLKEVNAQLGVYDQVVKEHAEAETVLVQLTNAARNA